MLDDRSKVWRANNARRAAPMRALSSSTCRASARALRRSASRSSCTFCSAASSAAAASVSGALSFDLGFSSARRLADASSLGASSAMTPWTSLASGSLSARSRCKSASERVAFLNEASISMSAARTVSSRWRGESCAFAAEKPARPTAMARDTRNRAPGRSRALFLATGRRNSGAAAALRRAAPFPSEHGRAVSAIARAGAIAFTLGRENGCARRPALLDRLQID